HAVDPRTGRRKEVRRERECTLKEAIALQHEWSDDLRESDERTERMRLADFARSWLAGRLGQGRPKPRPARKSASGLAVHVIPVLGAMSVDAIRPTDIERWLQHQLKKRYSPGRRRRDGKRLAGTKPYSPRAVLGHLRVLRTLSRAAQAMLGLGRDFCEGV